MTNTAKKGRILFSPREFLKAQRPEKFSDSVIEEQAGLDRRVAHL